MAFHLKMLCVVTTTVRAGKLWNVVGLVVMSVPSVADTLTCVLRGLRKKRESKND